MKRFLLFRLALVAGLLLLLPGAARPARADIAPPEPGVGSNLFPASPDTRVRMLAESVEIEVAARSQNLAGEAVITASFQMRNMGEAGEEMPVRFPLCASAGGIYFEREFEIPGVDDSRLYAAYPTIRQFSAWVEESPVKVTTTSETVIDYRQTDALGRPKELQVPCWANFPVRFPSGKDVNVRVRYIQQGYPAYSHGETANYIQFSYYLFTGAGWEGSIGSADIRAKLPFEASAETVLEARPEGAQLEGDEIRWHFEDFEPTGDKYSSTPQDPGVVVFAVMHPGTWEPIATARQRVAARPEDGEAWGQLGKAYKSAVRLERGLREDEAGQELYRLSLEAYQKAVELLPGDADWHYGFADLVCYKAEWHWLWDGAAKDYALCIEQLQRVFDLNPKHVRALALLEELAGLGLVEMSEPPPAFLTVTPRPAETLQLTETPLPTGEAEFTPGPASEETLPAAGVPTAFQESTAEETLPPTSGADQGTEAAPASLPTALANQPGAPPEQPGTGAAPPAPETASPSICAGALLPALAACGLITASARSRRERRAPPSGG